jgi:hypothetical protein
MTKSVLRGQDFTQPSPSRSTNIPVVAMADIYQRLSETFGDKGVIIGGRAVNLLCFHNQRQTNDVDYVVDSRANPEALAKRAVENGFTLIRDERTNKLLALSDKHWTDGENKPIRIDLYFTRDIGVVGLDEITSTAVRVRAVDQEIRVAAPHMLILMKYQTWMSDNRGRGKRRGKDGEDLKNIITNIYGTPEKLFEKEQAKLSSHINEGMWNTFKSDINSIFNSTLSRRDQN